MFKKIVSFALCLVACFSLFACGGSDPTIKLSKTKATVEVGKTVEITATVTPDGSTVEWESEDEDIATVEGKRGNKGKITGVSAGKVDITAYVNDKVYAVCKITVKENEPVISIAETNYTIKLSDTLQLNPTLSNSTAAITYTSLDTNVATVSTSGLVTPKKSGTVTIKLSATGAEDKTVTVVVTKPTLEVDPDSVGYDTPFYNGSTVVVIPELKGMDGDIVWTSEDESIATVDDEGTITAVAEGETFIYAMVDGFSASVVGAYVEVKVTELEPTLTVTPNAMKLALNASDTIIALLENSDATIQYTSANNSIATVNSQGQVTGVAEGTTTITVSVPGEPSINDVTVSVIVDATTLSVDKYTVNIQVGGSDTVSLTNPQPGVVWTSQDSAIATVNNGVITGVAIGSTKVFATLGSLTAEISVNVSGVFSFATDSKTISVGKSAMLTATGGATPRTFYNSSDSTVVQVDSSGRIVARKVGTATITATNAGKTATCTVTVKAAPVISATSVTLRPVTGANTVTLTVDNMTGIVWSSDNEASATVDENTGVVTAVSAGSATITATDDIGETITCEVTVIPAMAFVNPPLNIEIEESKTLTVSNTNGATITFSSSDTSKATVGSSTGVVTGVAEGSVTITATNGTDGTTVTCTIEVVGDGEGSDETGDGSVGNESADANKIQINVHNFDGGYGSQWLVDVKQRFEAKYADYTIDDPAFEGKEGIQIMITSEKNSIMGLADKITINNHEVYFSEYAEYYKLLEKGVLRDITEAVTTPIGYGGADQDRNIVSKLTAEQQNYFGVQEGDSTKYYGLPHYTGYGGLHYDKDLFDEYLFYFSDSYNIDSYLDNQDSSNELLSLFIASPSDKKSKGPDGQYNTEDDGLPTTYDEFFALCDYIRMNNLTPIDYAGAVRGDYLNILNGALFANIAGLNETMLNYNFSGSSSTLGTVNSSGKFVLDSTPTAITESNGYLLARQAGKFYTVEFMKRFMSGGPRGSYYGSDSNNTAVSHMDCQRNFVMGAADSSTYDRTAMIVEGCWWENEADSYFKTAAQKYGSSYSRQNRKFAIMPLPQPTKEMATARANGTTKRTMFDMINSICCVKVNVNDAKMNIINEFIKFVHTDTELVNYSVSTSTTKSLNYEIPENKLSQMTYYGRSIYLAKQQSDVVIPNATSNLFMKNPSSLSYACQFRTTLASNGETKNYPHITFYETSSKNTTVKEYFEGMLTYMTEIWSTLQK